MQLTSEKKRNKRRKKTSHNLEEDDDVQIVKEKTTEDEQVANKCDSTESDNQSVKSIIEVKSTKKRRSMATATSIAALARKVKSTREAARLKKYRNLFATSNSTSNNYLLMSRIYQLLHF